MENKVLEEMLNELLELKHIITSDKQSDNRSLDNLNSYVKLRSLDISKLQNQLTSIGLSSLGRAQSCVLNSLNQDIVILSKLLHKEYTDTNSAITFDEAKSIMIENSKIFGRVNDNFLTKVMVTLPSEAKESPELISNLIANGTSVFRINTAHDDAATWNTMARYIKDENLKQNRNVKIYVDLAGPKNRTGSIKRVFNPFKIGSWRDPKLVKLLSNKKQDVYTAKGDPSTLVVTEEFYELCKQNSKLKIDDFERERVQTYDIIKQDDQLFINANKKITIFEDTTLSIDNKVIKNISKLYNLYHQPIELRVFCEDKVIITDHDIIGQNDFYYDGEKYAAVIGTTNKEIFKFIAPGDEIFIDDGKIGLTILKINDIGVVCKVFLAKENGTVIKEEKGINFPNTDLDISAITQTDERNFEDIVDFADIIGLSFAQTANDIKKLQNMLEAKGKTSVAIAPKIETKTALENLPDILKQLLKWENYAIMIARGDLAIEVGFDNLPYIQDEIFGICEAAHVPVIYATQILEGKMKNNLPTRAEVTDAANAQRADCVMLNKGPFVVDTVIAIKNILRNIHKLHQKNRQLFSVCETWKAKN